MLLKENPSGFFTCITFETSYHTTGFLSSFIIVGIIFYMHLPISCFWFMQLLWIWERFSPSGVCYLILAFYNLLLSGLSWGSPGVVACTCNPATLEPKYWNVVGSIPVGGNSPSIGGWTEWPTFNTALGEEPNYTLGSNWDLTMNWGSKSG